ncbi:MAG: COG1615 family transporter [Leptolyngbyaceae cyanobacterium SM2_3_12]|nr:COG1615 family transporter [Leptolyngbyaceae cyanobacterium SM2_3_12]
MPKTLGLYRWGPWVLGVAAVLIGIDACLSLLAERFWFQEVNYLEVFWLRLRSQLTLGVIPILLTLGFTWGNLYLADRARPKPLPQDPQTRMRSLGLTGLLILSLTLALLVGVQLIYQGQIAADFWRQTSSLYDSSTPLPLWPKLQLFTVIFQLLIAEPWQVIALGLSTAAFLFYPRQLGRLAAVFMSLGFGLILAGQWPTVLLALQPASFTQREPIFNRDISFYIFRLPVWHLLEFWLIGVLFFTLVTVCLVYLLGDNTLSRGRFYGFSGAQQQHLYSLAGMFFLVTSLSHWLGRYDILYSQEGVVYGAGYTHVHVNLPVNVALTGLTLVLGLSFLGRGLLGSAGLTNPIRPNRQAMVPLPRWQWWSGVGRSSLLVKGICSYLLLILVGLVIAPMVVQRLVVQPNELQRERPYIANSIQLTRAAFDLEDINSQPFDPSGELTVEDLEANDLTIENIRLWDTRPLLESNRQLQQIRLYYEFKDADI